MGREAGGGLRIRTHVDPWLIHVNVWQKPLQYCKVISLQLKIKINKFTKKKKQQQKNTTLPVNAGDIKRRGFHPWVRKIPWGRAWQPTPVFLPGESHGQEEAGRL